MLVLSLKKQLSFGTERIHFGRIFHLLNANADCTPPFKSAAHLTFLGSLFATKHQQQKKQVRPVEFHSQDGPSYGPVQIL